MARGQRYSEEIKERAFALAAITPSVSAIAKELNLPRTTVKGWLEQRSETDRVDQEALHRQHQERFVEEAWRIIHAGQETLVKRLERAAKHEAELDEMLVQMTACADALTAEQIKALIKQFQELKIADIGKLAVVLGTMYDKQALIAKEATARVEVTDVRFEDL